jgi:glyoxylase-like metal-dependent hydrolase (beta-lactamase superfamily II)
MIARRTALAFLSAAMASPWLADGAFAEPLTYTLKPEPISPGVWLIRGAQEAISFTNGGAIANVAILNTKAGAVVIDTGPSKHCGETLVELATELTGKPVARVYLTHFYPDHVFGCQGFAAKIVLSTADVAQGLRESGEGFSDSMYRSAGDWMRGTEVVIPQPPRYSSDARLAGGDRDHHQGCV